MINRAALDKAFRLALTVALGALGGSLGLSFGVPLPWLLGAAGLVTVAAILRAPVYMSNLARLCMTALLGVHMGSHFKPEPVSQLDEWAVSIFVLMVFVVLSTALVFAFVRRVGGYSFTTAFFSVIPGGINELTLIGGQMGGDERILGLSHSCRLLLTIMLMPVFLYIFTDASLQGTAQPLVEEVVVNGFEIGILLACAVSGTILANWLRIPGGVLVGPMLLSGFAHFQGFVVGSAPDWIICAAQVIVGAAIGSRFGGISPKLLAKTMAISVVSTAIQLNLSLLFAMVMTWFTGLPIELLIMAYAPGGVVEICLLALTMGRDVTFIIAHSTIRATLIVLVAPAVYNLIMFSAKRQKLARADGGGEKGA